MTLGWKKIAQNQNFSLRNSIQKAFFLLSSSFLYLKTTYQCPVDFCMVIYRSVVCFISHHFTNGSNGKLMDLYPRRGAQHVQHSICNILRFQYWCLARFQLTRDRLRPDQSRTNTLPKNRKTKKKR